MIDGGDAKNKQNNLYSCSCSKRVIYTDVYRVEGKKRDYSRCSFLLFCSSSVNTYCRRKRAGCTPGACISWLDYPVLMTMTDIVFELEILLFVQSSSPSRSRVPLPLSSVNTTRFLAPCEHHRDFFRSLSCDLMLSSNNFGRMGVSVRNLQNIVKIASSHSLFRPKRFP